MAVGVRNVRPGSVLPMFKGDDSKVLFMMRNHLTTLFISWLFLHSSGVAAGTRPDTILYEQKLRRFWPTLRDNGGKIFLTDHFLVFKTRKAKNDFMSFSIRYNQIEKIRRANTLIFPNMIIIKAKDGRKYGLGTYRRKRIVEITRRKMKE